MNEKTNRFDDKVVKIKKYANRRLYNMQTSSYITLEDISALVKEGVEFVVFDAKTEDDLTRQVLMQIILEQETAGSEMVPIDLLRNIIRFSETQMHQSFSNYLTQSMQYFSKGQQDWLKSFADMSNFDSLQEKQREWLNQTLKMMNPLGKAD